MQIVVMCETYQQFSEYVGSMLRDRNKIPVKVSFNHCSSICDISGVQFIYCGNNYALKGHSFSKEDRIVKVGSWYNLSAKVQEDIVTEFKARI